MSLKQFKAEILAAVAAEVAKVEGLADEAVTAIEAIFENHASNATTDTEKALGDDADTAQVVAQSTIDELTKAATDAATATAAAEEAAKVAEADREIKVSNLQTELDTERAAHAETKAQLASATDAVRGFLGARADAAADGKIAHGTPANVVVPGGTVRPTGSVALPIKEPRIAGEPEQAEEDFTDPENGAGDNQNS